jgi:hypothetical protein
MKAAFSTNRPRIRGAAQIEMALVLPVLMLFIYGIMEYGWMFYHRTSVQEALRQGCRLGATLDPEADDIQAEVETTTMDALAGLGINCDDVPCTVQTEVVGTHPTEAIECRGWVVYQPLIRLVPTPERLSAGYMYYLEVQ